MTTTCRRCGLHLAGHSYACDCPPPETPDSTTPPEPGAREGTSTFQYWLAQESKPTCSWAECTRPAIVWTRRRSFCRVHADRSATLRAYEQLRDVLEVGYAEMLEAASLSKAERRDMEASRGTPVGDALRWRCHAAHAGRVIRRMARDLAALTGRADR